MLLGQKTVGERGLCVGVEDLYDALQDDHAAIDLLIDEIDSAAGVLRAVVEGLLRCAVVRESRQERGVKIERAVFPLAYEAR